MDTILEAKNRIFLNNVSKKEKFINISVYTEQLLDKIYFSFLVLVRQKTKYFLT